MNQNDTFHKRVRRTWEIFKPKEKVSPKERTRAMREVVRRVMYDFNGWDDQPRVPRLDFRSDHQGGRWSGRWSIEQPIQIGSGRAAEWCHAVYLWYALTARLLHERLDWSGQVVRDTAASLVRRGNFDDWVPKAKLPETELLRALRRPASLPYRDELTLGHGDAPITEEQAHKIAWALWVDRVQEPAWGSWLLDHYVARLRADPTFTTPSLIVGEIRRLRGADVTDMRGTTSGAALIALARRPELHDELLARAGGFVRTKLGLLDAVYVPFGLEAPAEFDYCHTLHMSGETRVRRAEYEALRPEQKTRLLVS
jgi:hypothetical protein